MCAQWSPSVDVSRGTLVTVCAWVADVSRETLLVDGFITQPRQTDWPEILSTTIDWRRCLRPSVEKRPFFFMNLSRKGCADGAVFRIRQSEARSHLGEV